MQGLRADIHFENVGGALLDDVLPALGDHARIVLCGMVAHYDTSRPQAFRNLHLLLERAIEVRPFRVSEHARLHPLALRDLRKAVMEDGVVCHHTIASGLAAAPGAFVAMLSGAPLGKSLVRLDES